MGYRGRYEFYHSNVFLCTFSTIIRHTALINAKLARILIWYQALVMLRVTGDIHTHVEADGDLLAHIPAWQKRRIRVDAASEYPIFNTEEQVAGMLSGLWFSAKN